MIRIFFHAAAFVLLALAVSTAAHADEWNIPRGSSIQAFFNANTIRPGDVVNLPGNATYAPFRWNNSDAGTEAAPVVLRGVTMAGETRPLIDGRSTAFAVDFFNSHHVRIENVEITQNGQCTAPNCACVRVQAHDVTVRDARIFDCAQHGVLSSDQFSGSVTLEQCEITDVGATSQKHAIYIAGDQSEYPNARFRMVGCHVHRSNGGNLVKSRAARNEIYGNWLEAAVYHELQLIGPDRDTPNPPDDDLVREDGDVVGNVFVHDTGTSAYAVHLGGDDNGETFGRVRLVNNTFVMLRADHTAIRIVNGFEALDAHHNVFVQANGGAMSVLRDVEADWVAGRRVSGSRNFVQTNAARVPSSTEWTATIRADSARFVSLAAATIDLHPLDGTSPLVDTGGAATTLAGYAIAAPQFPPCCEPRRSAVGAPPTPRPVAGTLDLGAYELAAPAEAALFSNGFE